MFLQGEEEEEWELETVAERKARHDRYAEIAAEKAPKSLSLQEQAKAIAEPLESLGNGIEFLTRFKRSLDGEQSSDSDEESGSDTSRTDSGQSGDDEQQVQRGSDHDYAGSQSFRSGRSGVYNEVVVETQNRNDNNNNIFSRGGNGISSGDPFETLQQEESRRKRHDKQGRERQTSQTTKKAPIYRLEEIRQYVGRSQKGAKNAGRPHASDRHCASAQLGRGQEIRRERKAHKE